MKIIYEKDAIDVVHKAIYEFFDICDDDEESPMTYKDMRLLEINKAISTRIKELPSAEPEQRWIPWDSGRLPDDSGTYIVTAYDGVQERVTFAKYQKRLKRWELTGARAYWRVLAWMPLPEPYAERREEHD